MRTSERRPVGFEGTEADVCTARDQGRILILQQLDYVMDVTNGDAFMTGNPAAGMLMTIRLLPLEECLYNDLDEDGNRQFPVRVDEDPSLLFLVLETGNNAWFLSCGGPTHCQRCRDRETCSQWEKSSDPRNPFGDDECSYEYAQRLREGSDEANSRQLAEFADQEAEYQELCLQRQREYDERTAAEEEEENRFWLEQRRRQTPKRPLRRLLHGLLGQKAGPSDDC